MLLNSYQVDEVLDVSQVSQSVSVLKHYLLRTVHPLPAK